MTGRIIVTPLLLHFASCTILSVPSFRDRISQASKALFGRGVQYGYLPPSRESVWNRQFFGVPPPFNPREAKQAYSDNPWLHSGINVIANEVASTKFRLVRKNADGEFGSGKREGYIYAINVFPLPPVDGPVAKRSQRIRIVDAAETETETACREGLWSGELRLATPAPMRACSEAFQLAPLRIFQKIES